MSNRHPAASPSASPSFVCALSLLTVYLLLIGLVAPFAVHRVEAAESAPSSVKARAAGSGANGKSATKRAAQTPTAPHRDGEILARFRPETTPEAITSLLGANGLERRGTLRGASRIVRLSLLAGHDFGAALAALRANSAIEIAEPNYLIAAAGTNSANSPTPQSITPDDPRYAEQWALRGDAGISEAWSRTTGATTTVIAVVDSGIDFAHPDLNRNRWTNAVEQANSRDDNGDGYADDRYGWDYITDTGIIKDELGHGTAVAGIIAAEGNNAIGIAGVMWRASLMNLRVLDAAGSGDTAHAVEAIDYAAAHGAKVINLSWGTDGESLLLQDAIRRAGERKVIVVCAAGNGNRDITTTPYYPASFDLPNLLAIAATDQSGALAARSNWSVTRVHLAAPGVEVLTTKAGGGYETIGGTSAAAAMVGGIAGLIRTERPGLTATKTKDVLTTGARQTIGMSGKVAGGGTLSAASTLAALAGLPVTSDESSDATEAEGAGGVRPDPNTTSGSMSSVGNTARRTISVPAMNLPNLDALRNVRPDAPRAPRAEPSLRRRHDRRSGVDAASPGQLPGGQPTNGNPNDNGNRGGRQGTSSLSVEGVIPDVRSGEVSPPLTFAAPLRVPHRSMVGQLLASNSGNRYKRLPSSYLTDDPMRLLSDSPVSAWQLSPLLTDVLGNTATEFTARRLTNSEATGSSFVATAMQSSGSTPYLNPPVTLPGYIEAENYDNGGQGVAYYDTTPGNSGNQYRATDVDLSYWGYNNSNCKVKDVKAGEWLKYTVNVVSGGAYNLDVAVSSHGNGGRFHVEVDGIQVTDWMDVPNTGNWNTFRPVSKTNIQLTVGQHVVRVVMNVNSGTTGAVGDFDGLYFSYVPSTPYQGISAGLPGTLQTEDFDEGGEGVAYHDTDAGNNGGAYRQSDVDVGTDAAANKVVAWVFAGEWLNYTVNVARAGLYDFEVHAGSPGAGATLHLEVDGANVTGPVILQNTGAYNQYGTTIKTGVQLPAGQHVLRVVFDQNSTTGAVGDFDYFRLVQNSTPYGGTPVGLPGIVQAENFDEGGKEIAYHDTEDGNLCGGNYRSTDVEVCDGNRIGHVRAGEWLKYTVNVATSGTYNFETRLGAPVGGGSFHVEVDGVDRTGPVTVPNTGGWGIYQPAVRNAISLTAGNHVLRVVMDANSSNGYIADFDYFRFTVATNAPDTYGTAFVTGRYLSETRNSHNGYIGMQITTGAQPVTVNALGRLMLAGNAGTHNLRIVRASDRMVIAETTVTMAGGTEGAFKYARLAAPISLSPNTVYYVASEESHDGDRWYYSTATVTTTPVAAVNDSIYFDGANWLTDRSNPNGHGAGHSNGLVDFKYTTTAGSTLSGNVVGDFSATNNPAGAWSYGYRPAAGGEPFTLYNSRNNGFGAGLETWTNSNGAPFVTANASGVTRSYSGVTHPADLLNLHPGEAGERSVVRWTAPSGGTYTLTGRFEGLATTTTDVTVAHNGTVLSSGQVNNLGSAVPFTLTRGVAAGETIEFSVGRGSNNTYYNDSTGLAVTITPVVAAAGDIVISEFRLRGERGASDEFIELFNRTETPLVVNATDGSSGWSLVSSDGITRTVIPNGTTIPGRGYYLITGEGYSLGATGAGTTARGDLSYTGDIPDNSGIALFSTTLPTNFTQANRLDAVGFTTTSDARFYEGTTAPEQRLSPIGTASGQHSFVRRYANVGGHNWQDTNVNNADFFFVATDAGIYGGVQTALGVPSPRNRDGVSFMPVGAGMTITSINPNFGSNAEPNFVFDTTTRYIPSAETNTRGRLIYRRRIFNDTGRRVLQYRIRVTRLTTLGNRAADEADVRAIPIEDEPFTLNGTPTLLKGMKVVQPPVEIKGGGINSSFTVDLGTEGLAPGAFVDVRFAFGSREGGIFRFSVVGEAITAPYQSATPGGVSDADYATARLDPANATGGDDLFSGNHHWSLPLVGLPGRAGMDLGLGLSYNSLVWTKSLTSGSTGNSSIDFDTDRGFPSPGFRLGFPTVQTKYLNHQTGKNAYLLITPSGGRVELRQVGTSNTYEAADSSYLQLVEQGGDLLVRSTDGTQMTMQAAGGEYRCVQIKDRNGNYLSAGYDVQGNMTSVVDTLGRTIEFEYDEYQNLIEIKQPGRSDGANGTFKWATFGYADLTINTNFSGMRLTGIQNGATIPVLAWVGLADGSKYEFTYTSWGQVAKITRKTLTDVQGSTTRVARAYTSYNLPADGGTAQADCPRFTERRDWAENWIGGAEAITKFGSEGEGTKTVTLPDGSTQEKVYFKTTGWERGLSYKAETLDNGIVRKTTTTEWTQDDPNPALLYQLNPRPTQTSVTDEANSRRTEIDYGISFQWGLPREVRQYGGGETSPRRRTVIAYNLDPEYTNRRIIGLVESSLSYGREPDAQGQMQPEQLASKVTYTYDETGEYLTHPGTMTMHDAQGFQPGVKQWRGLATSVKRWNVEFETDATKAVVATTGYNTAGAVVWGRSPKQYGTQYKTTISYADNFSVASDNGNATIGYKLAYPTRGTDADGFYSTAEFDYHTGAVTRTRDPKNSDKPVGQGVERRIAYDANGRATRVSTFLDNLEKDYVRYDYPVSGQLVNTRTLIDTGLPETLAWQVFDGAGRAIAAASDHPDGMIAVAGRYTGRQTIHDVMGRVVEASNPAEMRIMGGVWQATGDDSAGWAWTGQRYDWKGRPTITTNADLTTRSIAYAGCGCAGGEVATTTDEVGRRQRSYSDILGRAFKQEDLNADGGVYRTMTNLYNARDQVVQAVQRAGTGGAGQTTAITYDGHGRRRTTRTPSATGDTVYDYDADDAVEKVTDARNASATYTYNARGLVSDVVYGVPGGSEVAPTANVHIEYDSTGRRSWMSDGEGRVDYGYDALSRLADETRQFNGVGRSHKLEYGYNLSGGLKSITDPFGAKVNYTLDGAGRLESVTGENFAGGGSYASGMKYRAWGGLKGVSYGNALAAQATYSTRLQISAFAVTGGNAQVGEPTVMSAEYRYYGDGGIRYMSDKVDHRFDRAFTYDAVGRLNQAFSGGEAQNFYNGATTGSGVVTPYSQTIEHDEWGNMTGNASRFWSGTQTTTASYHQTTGRNAAWVYDASGNVTQDENRIYKWDAAGRNSRAVSTHDASNTLVQGYDGDGQRVRKVETMGTTSVTTLYVTSSALGGRVVSELNAAGEKTTTYVYGAGEVIAKQEVAGGTSSVRWVHQDPIVGSRQETSATGATLSRTEVDAQGVDVGLSDPYANQVGGHIQPEIPTLLPYDEISGRFGGGGCTLDGMEIGCGRVAQLLDSGAAVRAPEQTVATVYIRYQSGRTESFSGITTLPSGINVRFTGSHAQAAASGFTVGSILGGFGAGTTGYSRFESGVRGALEFGFGSYANRGAEVGRADGSQGWQSQASFLVPPASQTQATSQGPAPLTGGGLERYNKAKTKALSKLKNVSQKCASLLAKLGFGINEIIDTLNGQVAYDGLASTGVLVVDAYIFGDPKNYVGNREVLISLSPDTVSDLFKSESSIAAVTAIWAPDPTAYFRSNNIRASIVLHEALHSLTQLADIPLARKLGLGDFSNYKEASRSITSALKKNGCV